MASSQPQKDDKPAGPAASGNEASDANTTKKSPTALEEDDEFEDFPVEGAFFCTSTHPPHKHTLSDKAPCRIW